MTKLRPLRHELILLMIVILEWIYFQSVGKRFGTLDNTFDIVRHSVEIGLLAVAMTPIILTGGIDLSLGSQLGLCAIVFGKLWRDAGLSPGVAAVCTLGAGSIAGSLNALLIGGLRLPPLIVTLATYSLFRGLAEAITHGVDTFTNFPSAFLAWGQDNWLGVPAQAIPFVGVVAAVWVVVHHTSFGREFRVIGFASEGARYAGIPVERRIALVYIMAGIISAVAAIIYTARLGQAKADAGTGYELFAITAVVLGGSSIFGGTGTIAGTLLGVLVIAVLSNGLVHARQPRELSGMITALLLIAALAMSVLVTRLESWRTKRHAQGP